MDRGRAAVVRDNPQWNFLFLTKFPIRMAEFEYPPNAWLGTTVDLQARVKNAERAMRQVKASVKWLSLEPLIEPLHFDDLSAFQWIVIGGASASTQTPEWRPPRAWVWDLTMRARAAGCLVYHKTNLAEHRLKEFPSCPEAEPTEAPEALRYLTKQGPHHDLVRIEPRPPSSEHLDAG
jgi:protein gp37